MRRTTAELGPLAPTHLDRRLHVSQLPVGLPHRHQRRHRLRAGRAALRDQNAPGPQPQLQRLPVLPEAGAGGGGGAEAAQRQGVAGPMAGHVKLYNGMNGMVIRQCSKTSRCTK